MSTPKPFQVIAAVIAILVFFLPAPTGQKCLAVTPAPGEMLPNPGLSAPESKILYSAKGPIHLGDEQYPGWSYLYGNSFELEIYFPQPIRSLTLMLQTYGLEINAPVYLNYRKIAVLPRQIVTPTTLEKPDYWGPDLTIPLPVAYLCLGLNVITITTDLVPGPRISGDLDDVQMRNIRVIAK